MHINTKTFSNEILKLSPSHIIIGYSGGTDSSVLLNLSINLDIPVIAIYINHNLHKDSLTWQKHCQDTCNRYGVTFISHSLSQAPKGESFEAWASKQRMDFFKSHMDSLSNPILLLGHHEDDQAETFLIQAIRGSGLAGLAGIPYYKKIKNGAVLRPLLKYKKKIIEQFAKENNIKSIYDDSNEDIKYRRNLIRNKIIPELEKVVPNISNTLSRSANICAESNDILNKLLSEKLKDISQCNNIFISKFLKLDDTVKKSILHLWFKNVTNNSLKNQQVQDISLVLTNMEINTGWKFDINQNFQIYVEYGLLKIRNIKSENFTFNEKEVFNWLKDNYEDLPDYTNLTIRDRDPNDRCKYKGRKKSNKLKVLFQELKIPEDQRYKTKIISNNEKIIAVYPFFICE